MKQLLGGIKHLFRFQSNSIHFNSLIWNELLNFPSILKPMLHYRMLFSSNVEEIIRIRIIHIDFAVLESLLSGALTQGPLIGGIWSNMAYTGIQPKYGPYFSF